MEKKKLTPEQAKRLHKFIFYELNRQRTPVKHYFRQQFNYSQQLAPLILGLTMDSQQRSRIQQLQWDKNMFAINIDTLRKSYYRQYTDGKFLPQSML